MRADPNDVFYEMEMNIEVGSLMRIKNLLDHYHNILKTLQDDSFKGIGGGASPHYKIKIQIEEEWI